MDFKINGNCYLDRQVHSKGDIRYFSVFDGSCIDWAQTPVLGKDTGKMMIPLSREQYKSLEIQIVDSLGESSLLCVQGSLELVIKKLCVN